MCVRLVEMLGGVKMSELEQRIFEVKRLFKEASERAFTVNQAYNRLEAKLTNCARSGRVCARFSECLSPTVI